MPPVHIALFLCDTPIEPVVKADGDYTDIFGAFFRNSLPEGAHVDYIIDSFDVRNKQEYPEDIDVYNALVMTGSGSLQT